MPCRRRSSATVRPNRLDLRLRQVRARRGRDARSGRAPRASPGERLEEVLAGAGLEVEHVRPDRWSRPPRGRRGRPASSCSGESEMPGRIGAIPTPAFTPAVDQLAQRLEPAARGRGARARSAARPPRRASAPRRRSPTSARDGRLDEDVEVADDHRVAGDQAERVRRVAERLEAAARQPVPALGGLVRDRWRRRSRRPRLPRTGRASSRRSTSATFTFTRIERP